MDAKEYYRKVISNPWSWECTSDHLFCAANDLCDIYQERLEADRKYFRERLEADTKRIEKEMEQLKAGKKPFISQDFSMTDYGKMICYENIDINLKSYVYILPIYMMLMGMAVENLAKGIKVARVLKEDNTIVNGATLKKLGILGHTAPYLIRSLGISLTDAEEKLLDDINAHLEWAGRYSAPSNEDKPVLSATVMSMTVVELEEEKVFEILTGLYKRLVDIFDMEIKDPFIEDLPWRDCTHSY